jgi:hypothetical protein
MNNAEMPAPQLGDHVEMRKPHPCGSREWVVYRIGGDIGLRCAGCGHRMLMPRSVFNKSVKRLWHAPSVEGRTP